MVLIAWFAIVAWLPRLFQGARWLFTGTRLVSGASMVAINVTTQVAEHQTQWDRYNWGSVVYDYFIAAIGYSVVIGVVRKYPVLAKGMGRVNFDSWFAFARFQIANYGRLHGALAVYYAAVGGIVQAWYSNTDPVDSAKSRVAATWPAVDAATVANALLSTDHGKRILPKGLGDPRAVVVMNAIAVGLAILANRVFGVAPTDDTPPTQS